MKPATAGDRSGKHRTGMLAVGAAAFAIACCAGLPVLVGWIGGLALAGVFGAGAAALVAAAGGAWLVVRGRRRACRPPTTGVGKSPTEPKP